MASVPQTPMVEPHTFSYAQAAKGRSPSFSSLPQPSKPVSETTETMSKGIYANGKGSDESTKATNSRRASEGQVAKAVQVDKGSKATASSDNAAQKHAHSTPPTPQHKLGDPVQSTISMPSSPDFSNASASTVPKEDDLSATPNDSSDATWDKQSQASQNGEKASSKGDVDKDETKSVTWEQAPSQPVLKEAPVPAVNIWQKRALDQQAKAGKDPKTHNAQVVISPLSTQKAGQLNTVKKENNPDAAKQDSRKAKSVGQKGEDGVSSPGSKESWKQGDRKYRNVDEAVDKSIARGARGVENVKPLSTAPPPPGDAMSWPTFDSAQSEDKRKTQEKPEKAEKEKTLKPHGKEKWVPVPYVPTAIFNTPLPPSRRGGRPARGGRDGNVRGGHVSQGSISGDKQSPSLSSPTGAPISSANEQTKGDMGPPRPGPLVPKPRRAASAGPPLSREQKKDTEANAQEKANEVSSNEPRLAQDASAGTTEGRRASTATQTDGPNHSRRLSSSSTWTRGAMQQNRKPMPSHMDFEDRSRNPSDHAHPKSAGFERKGDASMRPPDFFREPNGYPHHRERVDSRSERGRGGFRGARGGANGFNGNHSVNGQTFPNGHSANPGVPISKAQSYNERHLSQPSIGGPYNSPQRERAYRTGTRSQSIPNPPVYGRYPNGPQSATQVLPPLQTHAVGMYEYDPSHPSIMSAMPYPPYIEQMQLLGMVQMQMEYYFSLDNLCKDMFLRKHMDSQGFVFLSVLTKFNRIKQLTSDIDLIRYVCLNAPSIEIRTGIDGIDRVRKRDGWQQWVLAVEEREETAKSDGPVQMQQSNLSDGPSLTVDHNPMAWRALYNPVAEEDGGTHVVPGIPQNFAASEVHPTTNGQLSDIHHTQQTPLSAAVPDFSPGLPLFNDHVFSPLDVDTSLKNTISDEQVESLMIVIRKPMPNQTAPSVPLGAAGQELPNGSAEDGTLLSNLALTDGPSLLTNGEHVPESRESDDRGFLPISHSEGTPSQVFWVKGKETSAIGDLPEQISNVSYTVYRHQALQQRENTPIGQPTPDMDILYEFWSHFLVRHYNARMYEQFRHLAYEDAAKRDSTIGAKKLATYYNDSILGEEVVSDEMARDFVDLVKDEIGRHRTLQHERAAFEKLRNAWRNGATNMRSRVKIDRILGADLKAELER